MVYKSSKRFSDMLLPVFLCIVSPIQYLDLLLPQLESKTLFLHQPRISEEFQTGSFPEYSERPRNVTPQTIIK